MGTWAYTEIRLAPMDEEVLGQSEDGRRLLEFIESSEFESDEIIDGNS
ncbi:hypothetical protein [Ferrimicrobium sp.]|nr:hypothetical protein [Ferrimicrobium sp.]